MVEEPVRFEFATAQRILFGAGALRDVPAAAAQWGRRALIVTGASLDRAAALGKSLEAAGVSWAPCPIAGEPSIEAVQTATETARRERSEMVISIGGGSAIDAGKAVAALLANPGDVLDYIEVIGRGQPLSHPSAPFIAIPTTAGTGSEVTRNAVLASPERRVKASLRSAGMLARLAVVDPELTYTLPREITAFTGLDAVTQLIEPYVSVRANVMTDLYCVEGLRRASTALPRAWANGGDRESRQAMSWASLLGGLSLANAGLGAVHGFAAPIGGMFEAPHGAVCAAVLPHAMAVNIAALQSRAPAARALARYDEIARLLTGRPHATAADAIAWVSELCAQFEIPPLRAYGVTPGAIPALIENAARASSMKANPIVLDESELTEILKRAL